MLEYNELYCIFNGIILAHTKYVQNNDCICCDSELKSVTKALNEGWIKSDSFRALEAS